jgi:hypothetical protein
MILTSTTLIMFPIRHNYPIELYTFIEGQGKQEIRIDIWRIRTSRGEYVLVEELLVISLSFNY